MDATKSYNISKRLVKQAYEEVKCNKGAPGIDGQRIEAFERRLKGNLYKIWNRMSSGSYFPPPVKGVVIPKKGGGERVLGIPTVADRVAQMVVKKVMEPGLEEIFLEDSYGYRPGKSALDAIKVTQARCWKYEWVLEYDIKGMFDNIDHEYLMRAVRKHSKCKWTILYTKRWLKAPMIMGEGIRTERNKGTPQGGVISPLLANLYMHYAVDKWLNREYSELLWCRYADDGLVHCRTEEEARAIKVALGERLEKCRLIIHPGKTRIVYCKDENRKKQYDKIEMDFLGYIVPRTKEAIRSG